MASLEEQLAIEQEAATAATVAQIAQLTAQLEGAATVEAELRQSFDAQNASISGFEDLQRKLLEAEAQAQRAVAKSRDSEAERQALVEETQRLQGELSRQVDQSEELQNELNSLVLEEQQQQENREVAEAAAEEAVAAAEAAQLWSDDSQAAMVQLRSELADSRAAADSAQQHCEELQTRLGASIEDHVTVVSLQTAMETAQQELIIALTGLEAAEMLQREQETQLLKAQAVEQNLVADCEQLRAEMREAQEAMEASLQEASADAESRLAAVEKEAAETAEEMRTQLEEARGQIDSVRGALQGMTETVESREVGIPRAICPCKVVTPLSCRSVCPSGTYSAYVICEASV